MRPAGRVEQPHDAARHRRLAAAGLADDAERLALADAEADAVDRLHRRDLLLEDDPARDREVLLQVLDDEQLVPDGVDSCSSATAASAIRHRSADQAAAPRIVSSSLRASRSFVSSSRWQASRCTGSSANRRERRIVFLADVHHVRAARMEAAAARRVEQRRRLALDLDEPLDVDVEPRQRAEQAPRVRHVRALEEPLDRRLLDHLGRVHDDDLVGDLGDDAEVVRDHDDRAPELLLELVHQRQDLRLRRHVERGRRLVGDQQVGVVDERHRDHHALAHAARELVRVVVDAPLGARDADRLEQLDRTRAGGLLRHVAVEEDRLLELLADRVDRVQRRHRILEDHRDVVAADLRAA